MKRRHRILSKSYFNRSTLVVAKSLLGKYLVRQNGKETIAGKIVEVEAYVGPHDLACHASKGRTLRTDVLFGPPGISYVYLIYGMYHCLNVVTERAEFPAAVLIRALEIDGALVDGPGRLCRALDIDLSLNRLDMTAGRHLWIEDRGAEGSAGSCGHVPTNRRRLCRKLGRETVSFQNHLRRLEDEQQGSDPPGHSLVS